MPQQPPFDLVTVRDDAHPVARTTGHPARTYYMSEADAAEFDREWMRRVLERRLAREAAARAGR